MQILTVIGARPQIIKASAVTSVLQHRHDETIVHTGQHYDRSLSDVFFGELELPSSVINLGVGSATHAVQTAEMLRRVEPVILQINPDVLLVYGDTNSTLAGALTAAKLHIPIAHVEAGVRHYDLTVPEEINRRLTDHVSSLLFCPTYRAVTNLKREGIETGVHFTGDVMLDLIQNHAEAAFLSSTILTELTLRPKEYVLATVHRASNTDDATNLRGIFEALMGMDENVVVPLHPRTRLSLQREDLYVRVERARNLRMLEPVGYRDFLALERNARIILTDSGGVQKEAFFLQVPCVTLREYSPWPETVEAGWNRLVNPSNPDEIIQAAAKAMSPNTCDRSTFGDGRAAFKIVEIMERMF